MGNVLELHAAGMLCAIAAAVFAAVLPVERSNAPRPAALRRIALEPWALRSLAMAALAVFFAVAWLVTPSRFPPPAALGTLAAVAAGLALTRPRWAPAIVLAAAAFAGVWVSVLRAQGLPFGAALPLAAAPAALGAWLAARRPGFASDLVREEALLLVGGFGLLVAVGAEVVAGWRSGLAFAAAPIEESSVAVGAWVPAVVAASVVLGGLYSVWKRRRR